MKKLACILLISLLLASFTSCANSVQKSGEPLIVGVFPDVDSIPVLIAKQNGYFEKQGVSVRIEKFKSAPDRDSALQSGKIDGAISDMLAAVFAREGGFDLKMTSLTNGSYKLLVGKNSGIHTITGLKGKSIAISKNTIIEYATDQMLTGSHVKPEEVNKVIIPQIPVRLEMLQNGKVDAAALPEPLASTAIKGGARLLNSSDQLGINPGVLIFTKKSADTKQDQINGFYRAYNQAVEYLQKEKGSTYIDGLIKEGGYSESMKDAIILPSYIKAALPPEKDFSSVIGWLKEKSLIKKPYQYNDLVDGRFVRSSSND